MSYRKILAAVDVGRNQAVVIRQALRVAQQFQAHLDVVAVLPSLAHMFSGLDLRRAKAFGHELRTHTEQLLRTQCAEQGARSAGTHVLAGSPAETVARFAESSAADLIVAGTHERDLSEQFLGTEVTTLLRVATCDVMGVKLGARRVNGPVIAAIDGGEHTRAVLLAAAEYAHDKHAVHTVCVLPRGFAVYETTGLSEDFLNLADARMASTVRAVLSSLGFHRPLHLLKGRPSTEIVAYAESVGSRLVVLGGSRVNPRIGRTANGVLHTLGCDALVINA